MYRNIDDDFFHSEQAVRQIGENDQFGELLNRSRKENLSNSGDDTIDKLIKAAMPIEKGGDSMADPFDLTSKSMTN